jgi:outer membrane receptor protein involved in Fe transport
VSALCGEDDAPLSSTTGVMVPGGMGYNAVFNTTKTTSNGFGGSLQLETKRELAGHQNQFVVGASYDGSQVTFGQNTQLGRLTIDRSVEGGGPNLAGAGLQTDLFAANHLVGLYALDTFDLTDSLSVQASARMNWYSIAMDDRLGNSLDGQHAFVRVNPALGLTQRLGRAVTLFAGYGESNRAPSAAELACADPDEPCRLPNAFVSDPPLKQVVSRSAEVGFRFRAAR